MLIIDVWWVLDYGGDLPVLEGTLIRLVVDHLPSDGGPKPLWLWSSRVGASSLLIAAIGSLGYTAHLGPA